MATEEQALAASLPGFAPERLKICAEAMAAAPTELTRAAIRASYEQGLDDGLRLNLARQETPLGN